MPDAPGQTGNALLLIDFQEDFLAPTGRMPVDQGQVQPVIAAARHAVDEAQRNGDLIVKIGNEFRPTDVIGNVFRHGAAMRGTPGAAWDDRIDPSGASYLPKWKADAFCNPDLADLLEEAHVGQICVAGLYAKACVSATAKSAHKRGLSVQVIGEATACSSDKSRKNALEKLPRSRNSGRLIIESPLVWHSSAGPYPEIEIALDCNCA